MPYYTYILQCSDDSFYIGHTEDLEERMNRHNSGRGTKYTADRNPVSLVYSEIFPTKAEAVARETQLKKWSRAKKQALISGDLITLKANAECRGVHGNPT